MLYKIKKTTDWKIVEVNSVNCEIPEDWDVVKIKDKIVSSMGETILSKNIEQVPFKNCIPVMSATKNFKNFGYIKKQDVKNLLENGDLIICARGTIGFPKIVRERSASTQTTIQIRSKKINLEYLCEYLNCNHSEFFIATGTIPQLTLEMVSRIEIKKPRSSEAENNILNVLKKQKDIISNLKILLEKQKARLDCLSEGMLSGRLRAKTTDGGEFIIYKNPDDNWKSVKVNGVELEIPEDWGKCHVSDLAEFTNGYPFSGKDFTLSETDFPVIRIRDLIPQKISLYLKQETVKAQVIKKGDLLIGMDGDFNLVEWAGTNVYLNQRILKVKPTWSNDKFYLKYILAHHLKIIQDYTLATTVKHLSSVAFSKQEILKPNVEERFAIGHLLNIQEKTISKIEALIKKQKQRLQYLSEELLSGRIIVSLSNRET